MNGTAESSNRILAERMRCLMIENSAPNEWWPFALSTAAYLSNRSPVSFSDIVPIHAFTDKKPDLAHIRMWGCWGYAKYPNEQLKGRNKLQSRSESVRLLGFVKE